MFFIFGFMLILNPTYANTRPEKALLEAGIVAAAGSTSDYPASDQIRPRFLPAPYIVYRGQVLKSDDQQGTRLHMLDHQHFSADMSFGGSFPAEGNHARQGMPDLDWTFEIGPRLLYYFAKDERKTVRLGLPLRAAFTTDFNTTRHIGYTLAPTFQVDWYDLPIPDLSLYFISTATFLTRGQAGYFYDVDARYATPERPTYHAREGYLGYDLSLAFKFSSATSRFLLVGGTRYADYGGSVNVSGPLHRKSNEWIYFAAIGFMLFESEAREIIY
ncbi:MipA/OmpV family protein [Pseudobdellovibrio exovorus]|uniref:MipA/OmpV family protein n=1 Tax=Pseudobdellovibrio exovorus JSS TaxID=1184267 RepID=M4VA85_9BACT|nr:MipA/OmpV family protein [Pseudobdellovibrio exovorus]AGH95380.1 hypothetical protein A11Q_1164 [Pseudobdellovibrio exovorus JSS]